MPSRDRRIRAELRAALAIEGCTISELFGAADLVVRPLVGAQGAAWSTFDPSTLLDTRCELIGDMGAGQVRIPNDPDRERQLFALEWEDTDPNTFAALQRQNRTAAALRLDVGEVAGVRRYREILEPMGAHDELRVLLRSGPQTWGGICLYRFDGSSFSAEDVEAAEVCGPVIADAIRLVVLDAARTASPTRPAGAILIGPDDRVLMTSPATEALLGNMEEGQVATALRSVAVATRAHGAASALITGDEGALVLQGSPAKGGNDGAVSIVVEEPRPAVLAPLIIDAFGLTDAQRAVAELTLQGLTRTQIARKLRITDHTVGDHLSSIYAQAGVGSRAELCALVFDRFYRPRRDLGATPGAYGFFLDPVEQ